MVSDQLGDGKDDVGAEERVDVFWQELGVATTVLRPVAVVADTSLASFKLIC